MTEEGILEEPGPEPAAGRTGKRTWKAVIGILCILAAAALIWADWNTQDDLSNKYMFGAVLLAVILVYIGGRLLFLGRVRGAAAVEANAVDVADSDETAEAVEDAPLTAGNARVQCPYCGAVLELSEAEIAAREYLCPECSSRVKMEQAAVE